MCRSVAAAPLSSEALSPNEAVGASVVAWFLSFAVLLLVVMHMGSGLRFVITLPDLVEDLYVFGILRPWDLSNPIRAEISLNLLYQMLQMVGYEPEHVF